MQFIWSILTLPFTSFVVVCGLLVYITFLRARNKPQRERRIQMAATLSIIMLAFAVGIVIAVLHISGVIHY